MANPQTSLEIAVKASAELTALRTTSNELGTLRDHLKATGADTSALDAEIAKVNAEYSKKYIETYTADLQKQIAATKSAGQDASVLEKRLEALSKTTAQAGQSAEGMGSKINGALAVLATGALAYKAKQELEALATQAVSLADRLDDLSAKSGQTAEDLQLIGNPAAMDGGTFEDAAAGLNNLQRAQSDVLAGDAKLRQSFEALNVTQEDLQKLKPAELLLKMADGAEQAKDRGAALSATMDVLGRSGRQLFGTMEKGSGEMRKVSNEMGILSSASVALIAQAKEGWEQFINKKITETGEGIANVTLQLQELAKGNFKILFADELKKKLGEIQAEMDKTKVSGESVAGTLEKWTTQFKESQTASAAVAANVERIAAATADQEQTRIKGLVDGGFITPEEGARQMQDAQIKAEREALLRQREGAQSESMTAAGQMTGLEDLRKKGGDTTVIDAQMKELEKRRAELQGQIDEANIRLETNGLKRGNLDASTARAAREANDQRRTERYGEDDAAAAARAKRTADAKAAFEAKPLGYQAISEAATAAYPMSGNTGTATGQMAAQVMDAAKKALASGDSDMITQLVTIIQQLLDVGVGITPEQQAMFKDAINKANKALQQQKVRS